MVAINRSSSLPTGRRDAIGAQALLAASAITAQTPASLAAPLHEWRGGSSAGVTRRFNGQVGALQLAGAYLKRLAECVQGNLAGAPDGMAALDALLEARPQLAGGFLDAHFVLDLDRQPRSELVIAGLTSLQEVARAGAHTLLFSASRHPGGPLAVVLDEGLSQAQILARLNAGLAPAGLRAHCEAGSLLIFSAQEADWLALKGRVRVQGEGRLVAGEGAMPLIVEERGLFDTAGKADLANGARHLVTLQASIGEQLAGLLEQLDGAGHREAQRQAHDISTTLKEARASYALYAGFVTGQANLGRSAALGLLG